MDFFMDDADWQLLQLVQENGKMAYADLGQRVGLSVSAVNERLKKLQTAGIVRGYVARLDPQALGLGICAFVQISINRPADEAAFLKQIATLSEVQECHHITGEFSYLLKVRVRGTAELEALIKNKIKTLNGIVQTHTLIALSTAKETPALYLEGHPETRKRKRR
ncbi:MAG: Lrp/AsnC family transcriptional regulator [Acidobacteria bacterium]|nr:Lrp/AsnC family transcriptional regulator [Acidobacteriota bacterium]MCI0626598.1 Lrp/AsnC family transcriptional regulator [Acidobacteriota bacterium]MCI0719427.1 Lrp/AsnC family transcriptional regulator [Acidobacteriota bacterium]